LMSIPTGNIFTIYFVSLSLDMRIFIVNDDSPVHGTIFLFFNQVEKLTCMVLITN
jgi:hypothetical protein